jgi:protein-disulfide isomerase-like protein with CxxC motif
VRENTDFETGITIAGLVFTGILGHKHQCRPATDDEMQQQEAERIREATGFMYAQQRFSELLVEVLGA